MTILALRGPVVAAMAVAAMALGGCTRDAGDSGAGPGSPAVDGPPLTVVAGAYLGRGDDGKVFVAVVPGNNAVRVYASNGEDLANATVNQWFEGPWNGIGPVTLSAGGLKVTVRAEGFSYTGDLTLPNGTKSTFTATQRVDASALLDARATDANTGKVIREGNVIVLADEQRGVMVQARPKRCRVAQLTGSNGQSQWVSVCV